MWAITVLGLLQGCRWSYELTEDALAAGGSGGSLGGIDAGDGGTGSGGSASTGGASGGATSTGGSASGGTTSTGGSASGGTTSTGGSAAGGSGGTGGCEPTTPSTEVCDGLDNDCSGEIDEGDVCASDCFADTFGEHGYMFCGTPRLFADAQAACAANSMSLVRIDDDPENTWLTATAYADTTIAMSFAAFIAASDALVEGEWRWPNGDQFWSGTSNGTPVGGLYENWASNEPNSNAGNEDCAGLRFNGTWADIRCSGSGSEMAFICETGP